MNLIRVISLLLALVAASHGSCAESMDLLESICLNEQFRVTHVSTVEQIHRLIKLFPVENDQKSVHLTGCVQMLKKPIDELIDIIKNPNHEACSQAQVSKISKFHWNYVMGRLTGEWPQPTAYIPRPLIVFFINYSSYMTKLCADILYERVTDLDTSTKLIIDSVLSSSMGASLDAAKSMLVPNRKIKDLDSFLLIWHSLVNKLKRSGQLGIDEIDEDGDNIFAMVRTPEAEAIWLVQDTCRYKLRPVYQQTVLPVMRLIDMGYGFGSDEFDGLDGSLQYQDAIKTWYSATQVCELMLAVDFLKDSTLKYAKVVKSEEDVEFSHIERHPFLPRKDIESREVLMTLAPPNFVDRPISSEDTMLLLTRKIKSRAALLRRMLKNLFRFLRRHPIAAIKNLIASARSKSRKNRVQQYDDDSDSEYDHLDSIDGVELVEASENLLDNDSDGDEEADRKTHVNLDVGQKLIKSKRLVSSTLYFLVTLALVSIIYGLVSIG